MCPTFTVELGFQNINVVTVQGHSVYRYIDMYRYTYVFTGHIYIYIYSEPGIKNMRFHNFMLPLPLPHALIIP